MGTHAQVARVVDLLCRRLFACRCQSWARILLASTSRTSTSLRRPKARAYTNRLTTLHGEHKPVPMLFQPVTQVEACSHRPYQQPSTRWEFVQMSPRSTSLRASSHFVMLTNALGNARRTPPFTIVYPWLWNGECSVDEGMAKGCDVVQKHSQAFSCPVLPSSRNTVLAHLQICLHVLESWDHTSTPMASGAPRWAST